MTYTFETLEDIIIEASAYSHWECSKAFHTYDSGLHRMIMAIEICICEGEMLDIWGPTFAEPYADQQRWD